ncbi:MAG: cytochrome c-type biogenesis protein [bacterium]
MRRFWLILCTLCVPALAQETADSSATADVTALSALRRQLACYCGCGMTVQDCLGGMVCSESRALSKEVAQFMQQGKNRDQILQAMAAKYGERILSAPTKRGFNLMAWVVPFAMLTLGGVIVALVVKRWRRHSASPAPPSVLKAEAGPVDLYGSRFEEEFRKFQS